MFSYLHCQPIITIIKMKSFLTITAGTWVKVPRLLSDKTVDSDLPIYINLMSTDYVKKTKQTSQGL